MAKLVNVGGSKVFFCLLCRTVRGRRQDVVQNIHLKVWKLPLLASPSEFFFHGMWKLADLAFSCSVIFKLGLTYYFLPSVSV